MADQKLKLKIIVGSHRKDSESAKVANLLFNINNHTNTFSHTEIFDLGKTPLPLWDEEIGKSDRWNDWRQLANQVQESDALIIIAPEWAGMVPPALKNFLLLCGTKEVADKPVLIVSVSSARGGAYPISELRLSGYKNNRLVYLSEHLIFRNVEQMWTEPKSEETLYMQKRSGYCLNVLFAYAKALKTIRESGITDYKQYPNGM